MSQSVLRRVDHLIIRADGEGHHKLLTLLGGRLGLPSPWAPSDHPAFTSAGIFAGNVDFELLKLKGGKITPDSAPARLYGIVFETRSPFQTILTDLGGLRSRKVPYVPMPYVVRDSKAGPTTYWHNVFLGHLIGSNRWMKSLFFYKRLHSDRLWMSLVSRSNNNNPAAARFMFDTIYRDGIVFAVKYNPTWRDIDAERRASRDKFEKANGGGLGLRRVQSVQVGVKAFQERKALWSRLLGPVESGDRTIWPIGDGPAIELVEGESNGIRSMVWEVQSLDDARSFLKNEGIGWESVNGYVRIDPTDLYGLDIRLTQAGAS